MELFKQPRLARPIRLWQAGATTEEEQLQPKLLLLHGSRPSGPEAKRDHIELAGLLPELRNLPHVLRLSQGLKGRLPSSSSLTALRTPPSGRAQQRRNHQTSPFHTPWPCQEPWRSLNLSP